ncbi:MAG TPA: DUF6263 family protein [Phycisphaerales bacterium]|nr:DUF6263 family protein [Phycisphaerales bacterium]
MRRVHGGRTGSRRAVGGALLLLMGVLMGRAEAQTRPQPRPKDPRPAPVAPAPTSPAPAQPVPGRPSDPRPTPMPRESAPGEPVPGEVDRPAAGGIDLRPKFRQGDVHRFKLEIHTAGQNTLGGAPGLDDGGGGEVDLKQTIVLVLRVTRADQEGATLEMVYESLKLQGTGPMGPMNFDSTKPGAPDDGMGALLGGVVGRPVTVSVGPDGAITKVEGAEALMPLSGATGGTAEAKSVLGPIFTSKGSSGRARVGEKWTNVDHFNLGALGRLRMTTEHRLASARGHEASVALTGRLEMDSESGAAPLKLTRGDYEGVYVWDTERGMVRQMDTTQTTALEGDLEGMKVRSSTVTRVKLRPEGR